MEIPTELIKVIEGLIEQKNLETQPAQDQEIGKTPPMATTQPRSVGRIHPLKKAIVLSEILKPPKSKR